MKLIIAGSRHINPTVQFILEKLNQFDLPLDTPITHIVSGGAKGVDLAGEEFAKSVKLPVIPFYPNYNLYEHHIAPLIRNAKMAVYGDALLLIWDGSSRGSADMKRKMKRLNKPIYEVIIRG